ncbi:uncharacterized protein LOC123514951 [Portunus trituberculatus]|uniref:uncharacterized protein LOC123514951 n=1 Tax=Portunus trituberculatus TaxID=210409 RepID=UPI001E1CD1DB|nr:uncharacterized protein LOC123514951 [Portunus trituberculatus]
MKFLLASVLLLVIYMRLQVMALLRNEVGIERRPVQTFRHYCKNYYFNHLECDTYQLLCVGHIDCPLNSNCCVTNWCTKECVPVLSVLPYTEMYLRQKQEKKSDLVKPWLVFGLMRRLPRTHDDEFFANH